ncbi:TonB-dependent receptor [Marinomonas pollencensis]|uniref:Outer membrane receptor protein involved in Fe transport n=1 Tax=Marinomonas pollencensis TaxID=491954 RepID=A0A3E0DVC0_9GAMM|nr:TonB-dependent receptor [Marinomonas pollencensis]REG86805.1 outer membrane receptor protein involved in Fe transport [Marinomonas pollencensis]
MTNKSKFSPLNTSSRLSIMTMAFIGINTATLSSGVWADDGMHLDTIEVTGEKVSKDIKDTTTAVTVTSEDQYDSGQQKDINDIVTTAPNVTTGAFGTVNIRGVNSAGAAVGRNAFMTGNSPRISTVVDGVTESWGGYNFNPTDVWDSKQVEVLRGPQSTSQGSNAIGGAIVLETNDPTNYLESSVRAGLESYDNGNIKHNVAAMVSGPLIDNELSARVTIEQTEGDGYIDYVKAADDDTDYSQSESLNTRAKLLWTPKNITGLTVKVTGVHRENDGEYLNWVDNTGDGIANKILTVDDDDSNTRRQDSQVNSISTNIDYVITPSLENQLQISYSDYLASFEEYTDGMTLALTEKKTTLEDKIVFHPTNAKLTGFLGLYASQADTTLDVDKSTFSNYIVSDGTKTTLAMYGETTYALSDKLALTTGGRLQNENQDRTLVEKTSTTLDEDTTDTVFLPKLAATYDISQATTLGASITKGYNSGGAGLNWDDSSYYTFDPETVITYELSSKTRFKNNLTINASLFYNDYSDYQAYTDYELDNVDASHTYGAEIEIVALATNTLELRASAGTLKTKVDSTSSENASWQGNELSYSPDLNVGLGFTKYIGESWSVGADATYVSSYYSDMDNTESDKAGNYITSNTFIKYTYKDLTIDGYINNITNEDIIYQISSTGASVGASRTLGISATYRM